MPDLILRRGTRSDTDGICRLLRRSFPDNPKGRPEMFDWQYWDNPFGSPTVWLWEDQGRIVGHYAVIPYRAKIESRIGRLGIGIDAAIDPEYQGRQLFGPLASALYSHARADGVDAIVCYPNDNSVRGIARQGWTELGQLRTFVLPLQPAWFAGRMKVPTPALAPIVRMLKGRTRIATSAHDTHETHAVTTEADLLWARLEHHTTHGVIRDAAWLRWRYEHRPGPTSYRFFEARREGRLTALAVASQHEQRGGAFTYLLELLAEDERAARAVVARVVGDMPPAAGVLIATLPRTPLARHAVAAGLLPVPQRLADKQLHFGVVGDDASLRLGWSLGWGDLDHL